jgi:hypothetical protein
MATTSLRGLETFVAELGLGPVPYFATADVLNDPMDLCHSYLAEDFGRLVECDPELVYKAIQPPHTIQDGDLDIVLPRLKLSGGSPKELAGELLKQVCQDFQVCWTNERKYTNVPFLFRFDPIPSLGFPSRMASTFDSFSLPKSSRDSYFLISTTEILHTALSSPMLYERDLILAPRRFLSSFRPRISHKISPLLT